MEMYQNASITPSHMKPTNAEIPTSAARTPASAFGRIQKNKPITAVLLLGEDPYLRALCREQIVEHSVEAAARDWGVRRFSAGDDDFAEILGQARTVPSLIEMFWWMPDSITPD